MTRRAKGRQPRTCRRADWGPKLYDYVPATPPSCCRLRCTISSSICRSASRWPDTFNQGYANPTLCPTVIDIGGDAGSKLVYQVVKVLGL